ncbi:MAG TPA: hypothetical protein VK821_00700 [Dehalococcoidia bacterium]|nr:hypothetical protein [Dehalococcoidia bacterium]
MVAILVLVGLSSHIAIQHGLGVKQERQGSTRRRLGGLSRHIDALNESSPANEPALHSSDYSHYFVPCDCQSKS